jgi:hypothetical protein
MCLRLAALLKVAAKDAAVAGVLDHDQAACQQPGCCPANTASAVLECVVRLLLLDQLDACRCRVALTCCLCEHLLQALLVLAGLSRLLSSLALGRRAVCREQQQVQGQPRQWEGAVDMAGAEFGLDTVCLDAEQ